MAFPCHAPLIEATRAEYESKLRVQSEAFARQKDEPTRKERSAAEIAQQLEKREAELKRKSEEAQKEIEASDPLRPSTKISGPGPPTTRPDFLRARQS